MPKLAKAAVASWTPTLQAAKASDKLLNALGQLNYELNFGGMAGVQAGGGMAMEQDEQAQPQPGGEIINAR